ncbi:MAG: phosphoribosylformylglycinamidine synthase subunit PurQ [Bacteroidota bacterium]
MSKPAFGVVVFPGSNCDHDAYYVLRHVFEKNVRYVWHKETDISDIDVIILPGGFSYGDYLRSGAIARFSPVMREVVHHAQKGKLVLGICNGFQILLEANLLPGAMLRNASMRFICKSVAIRVDNAKTPFTSMCQEGDVLEIPIAHGDGNYYADSDTLQQLLDDNQIVFRYSTKNGDVIDEANPNGSCLNIAGITNKTRNVLGMMPHPERASDSLLGYEDGKKIFESIINFFN